MKRAALIALVLIQFLAAVISVSVFFVEEAEKFDSDANTLIATFGVGMAIFGIVLTFLTSRGERCAWIALWYWPLFFVLHVIALKTYIPDLVFAVVVTVALVILRPSPESPASTS